MRLVLALTFVLSYCSIVYELLLAQSLSSLLGNTFLRYNVTIGLYLAALGAGALLCPAGDRPDAAARLIRLECLLSLLGVAAPLLVFGWDVAVYRAAHALGVPFRGFLYQTAIHAFDHGLILAIGLLSGFELPLLMRLGGSDREGSVLAMDYGGTLLGALAFPLLLLPVLGLLPAAAATGLLNALCGLALLLRAGPGRRRGPALAYLGAVAVCGGMLLYSGPLERLLSEALALHPRP